MPDKGALREAARGISPPTDTETEAVLAGVGAWIEDRSPGTVLTFLAMPSELDLSPLVEAHPGIRWAVTRSEPSGVLTVHPYTSPMETHRYGFRQPVPTAERLDPETIDLVLVPGVLFDVRGGRLGHGAGYYDRFLPRVTAVTMGVTVERRVVDEIPMEAHDVRMQWLATDVGVRQCRWPDGAGSAPPSGSR
jgi:5-formyltetrahydrofolate cyclo-ligase